LAFVLLTHGQVTLIGGGFVGLDIFFVISGFLITGLLLRELEQSGTISLAGFYARRARRILPMAGLVLVAVLVASLLLFSPARAEVVAGDIRAAALYFLNWHFIAESTDYFGAVVDQSPVLHYWSLAVEEQFYLLWPLFLLTITAPRRHAGLDTRPVLWAGIGAVVVISLAYSIQFSLEAPEQSYFSTFARGWELGLGGLLALVAVPRMSPRIAAGLAGAGVAAIAFSAVVFDEGTPWPGSGALVPALGTLAVIAAGMGSERPVGVLRLLTLRPVHYVGRISYNWYLWHWPPLILAVATWGELATWQSMLIVTGAGIPAVISHHLFEEPFRRAKSFSRRPRRALALGSAVMLVGVAGPVLLLAAQPTLETAASAQVKGAVLMTAEPQKRAEAVRPNPRQAGKDRGRLHDDGCVADQEETEARPCTYGDPSSEKSVALFGDSHALMYFPALEPIARERGWRLLALVKLGCTPAEAHVRNPNLGRGYDECDEWREDALRRIEKEKPDMVVVTGGVLFNVVEDGEKRDGEASGPILEAGYAKTLRRLRGTRAKVAAIQDIPHAPHDVSDCVSESLDDLERCAFERGEAKDHYQFDVPAAREVEGVELVDMTPAICPDDLCRAVIGNAITYRGTNHLTATFARTLAPRLEVKLPDP
jgi:peptidoglycan/LPS O-acetylase OafA/YrhL